MLHPSYTELMDLINQDSDEDTPVVGSRYSVVMAAAKRARQIADEAEANKEIIIEKPVSLAIQDFREGNCSIFVSEDE